MLPRLPAPLMSSLLTMGTGTSAGGGGAGFVGALDEWEADFTRIFSPGKRLLASYEGHAVRVARDTDGVQSNIGFTPTGDLDIAALTTFLGGANPLIVSIPSQVGSDTLARAITLNQPTLGTNVSPWGMPAMVFGGSLQSLSLGTPISPTGLLMGVHSTASSGIGRYCAATGGDSSMFELGVNGAYGRWNNADGQVSVAFANSAVGHGLEMWYNGGSSIIRIDTAEEPSAATAGLVDVATVGDYTLNGGQNIIGSVAYMIALNTLYDATQRAALRAALASIFPFAT